MDEAEVLGGAVVLLGTGGGSEITGRTASIGRMNGGGMLMSLEEAAAVCDWAVRLPLAGEAVVFTPSEVVGNVVNVVVVVPSVTVTAIDGSITKPAITLVCDLRQINCFGSLGEDFL